MPSQSTPQRCCRTPLTAGEANVEIDAPPEAVRHARLPEGVEVCALHPLPPRGKRHALLPNRRRESYLARISLRARHPLLLNTELGTSTSLTAAASSHVSPPRALCGGFATAAKPRNYDSNQRQLNLARGAQSATDRQKELQRETRNLYLPEGDDLSTLLTISFPRHYFSKFSCN